MKNLSFLFLFFLALFSLSAKMKEGIYRAQEDFLGKDGWQEFIVIKVLDDKMVEIYVDGVNGNPISPLYMTNRRVSFMKEDKDWVKNMDTWVSETISTQGNSLLEGNDINRIKSLYNKAIASKRVKARTFKNGFYSKKMPRLDEQGWLVTTTVFVCFNRIVFINFDVVMKDDNPYFKKNDTADTLRVEQANKFTELENYMVKKQGIGFFKFAARERENEKIDTVATATIYLYGFVENLKAIIKEIS